LLDQGYQEIVLSGVALGLWGREKDPPGSLADLITGFSVETERMF